VSASQLAAKVKMGGGKASLATVQGGMLSFAKAGKGYTVTDAKGHTANITIADVNQSNGVIHVIDTVLLP
jgi:uncharacterized surface protein with fasciclin (FAS1) repeats